MNPDRRCDTCIASDEQSDTLFCRLNPPQVTVIMVPMQDMAGNLRPQFQTLASQPSIKPDGYCLSWKLKFKLTS